MKCFFPSIAKYHFWMVYYPSFIGGFIRWRKAIFPVSYFIKSPSTLGTFRKFHPKANVIQFVYLINTKYFVDFFRKICHNKRGVVPDISGPYIN